MKNNQDSFEQKSRNNLLKIFLSSFLTISFFYIAPIFINFADKNFYTKEYMNDSKKILAYTLNKEDKNKKEIETLNEEEVLVDIYSLNNSETEAVYLSAASINKLFKLLIKIFTQKSIQIILKRFWLIHLIKKIKIKKKMKL